MTYDEVVNKIPYRNLLIMSRDKMRVATGKVYREMTEAEERAFIRGKLSEQKK